MISRQFVSIPQSEFIKNLDFESCELVWADFSFWKNQITLCLSNSFLRNFIILQFVALLKTQKIKVWKTKRVFFESSNMSGNPNNQTSASGSGSGQGSDAAGNRGRARFRSVPTRTVMVFPTRDGDRVTVTISVGKSQIYLLKGIWNRSIEQELWVYLFCVFSTRCSNF